MLLKLMKLCDIMGAWQAAALQADKEVVLVSDSYLDLSRAPYALYGVKYIDLVSPLVKLCELMRRRAGLQASDPHLDLIRAPYVLYGVKYIDSVSLDLWFQAAVKQDGRALQHAAATLKADKEVVRAAVAQHGWALQHADASLKAGRSHILNRNTNLNL